MTQIAKSPVDGARDGAAFDDLAIRTLIARIAQLADVGSADEYTTCFTDDARWEMPGDNHSGRDDIRAASQARRDAGDIGPGSATRHMVGTIAVAVTGDEAEATSYFQFFVQTTTAPQLRRVGQYDDRFVRTAQGWLLAHRRITVG